MIRSRFAALIVAGLVAAPGLASASGFGRRDTSSKSQSSEHRSESSHTHGSAPVRSEHRAEAPSARPDRGREYDGGRRSYRRGYVRSRPWWGWGVHPWGYYGWGYYPYYGAPLIVAGAEEAPPPPSSANLSFVLGGMGSHDGGGFALNLTIEGRRLGFDFDLLTIPSVDPGDSRSVTSMPLLKANLTYSFLSDLHLRLRAEGGVESITAPGVTYVGPDVGVSGQLAIVGPLAAHASALWMPVLPVNILDLQAGLALNFGALTIQGGWRWVRLDDTNQCSATENAAGECGTDIASGPQLTVGIIL